MGNRGREQSKLISKHITDTIKLNSNKYIFVYIRTFTICLFVCFFVLSNWQPFTQGHFIKIQKWWTAILLRCHYHTHRSLRAYRLELLSTSSSLLLVSFCTSPQHTLFIHILWQLINHPFDSVFYNTVSKQNKIYEKKKSKKRFT